MIFLVTRMKTIEELKQELKDKKEKEQLYLERKQLNKQLEEGTVKGVAKGLMKKAGKGLLNRMFKK